MRDNQQTVKIELLSQWKLEAEFRKKSDQNDAENVGGTRGC